MSEFILITNQQNLLAEFKPLLPDSISILAIASANELTPLLAENANRVVIIDSHIFSHENKEQLSNILGFYSELPIVGLIDTNSPDISINSFHGFTIYRYLQTPLTEEKLQSSLNAASRKLNKTAITEEGANSSNNKTKNTNYVVLGVAVCVIVFLTLFVLNLTDTKEVKTDRVEVEVTTQQQPIDKLENNINDTSAIETISNTAVIESNESTQEDRINTLLKQAKTALATDQLFEPDSNNALSLYSKVLNIDSSNAEALEGIKEVQQSLLMQLKTALLKKDFQTIKENYNKLETLNSPHINLQEYELPIEQNLSSLLNSARAAINTEEYNSAQEYLNDARELSLNENINIQTLADKLNTSKSFSEKLNVLNKKFDTALKNKQLISPKNNNAVYYFESIQKLSNNTILLKELKKKLGTSLETQTNALINKDLNSAKKHLAATEKYHGSSVAALKQRILQKEKANSNIKQNNETNKRLRDLIRLTNTAIEQDRLLYPQNNNALYYLNKAKSMAPQDTDVLAKANVLVDLLLIQVRNDINENTLASATSRLNKAKELGVKNSKIKLVEKELKAAIQKQVQ